MTLKDRRTFERAVAETSIGGETPLAAWTFASHYLWRDRFSYEWADVEGWRCVFANYVDGVFMPLPPLGPASAEPSCGRIDTVVNMVTAYMHERNHGTSVTRIENIPEAQKVLFDTLGFRVTPKDSDYLYRTPELAALKGNRYKTQRAACNRLLRNHRVWYRPYEPDDHDACVAVLSRWMHQKEEHYVRSAGPEPQLARAMMEDAGAAHRVALEHGGALGLVGRVAVIEGAVCAYTFGCERSSDVFCVLLEVADRSVYGLAHYLFRELCREFRGYQWINTMDDSGLSDLARSKRAYHPCELVRNYIATPEAAVVQRLGARV